jgi:hypothetical protein
MTDVPLTVKEGGGRVMMYFSETTLLAALAA